MKNRDLHEELTDYLEVHELMMRDLEEIISHVANERSGFRTVLKYLRHQMAEVRETTLRMLNALMCDIEGDTDHNCNQGDQTPC